MIWADLVTAYRFWQALSAWRRKGVRGHIWLYVGIQPGQPVRVEPRRIIRTPGLAVVLDPDEQLLREVLA